MKVKLLTNLGSNDFPVHPFRDGETHEVDEVLGAKLVRARLAIDVTVHVPTSAFATAEPEPAPRPEKFQKMRTEPMAEPATASNIVTNPHESKSKTPNKEA